MKRTIRVNLICHSNQVGLSRDLTIIVRELRHLGVQVRTLSPFSYHRAPADLNIFPEIIAPRYLRDAPQNVVIPNPEWFNPEWRQYLRRMSVFAKTRDAARIFRKYTPRTHYVGFTSVDRRRPRFRKERMFLHVAGKSNAKGTGAVVAAWAQNPQFPKLTIVQSPARMMRRRMPRNVSYHARHIGEEELLAFQNRCRFHLCPSEYEGFGHYIGEALSTGAIVLTTGKEPMTELVPGNVGIHVRAVSQRRKAEAIMHQVSPNTIAQAVRAALELKPRQVDRRSSRARSQYEFLNRGFKRRFKEAICRLLPVRAI